MNEEIMSQMDIIQPTDRKSESMGSNIGTEPAKEDNQPFESISTRAFEKRMINNCLKLMNGKYGGGFYVKYVQDDISKHGWLYLIIQYPDGSCKVVVLFKNSFMETTLESDGVYNGSNKTIKKSNDSKVIPPLGNGQDDKWHILEKYSSPLMPIPGRVIWQLIVENYEQIPVESINNTVSYEELYYQMAECAIECSKSQGFEFMSGSDRYYVSTEEFKIIIEENGYKIADVRAMFDLMGLFIKDKNAGYQYSKRINGQLIRLYVLRKNTLQLSRKNIKKLEDIEFKTDVKTKEQIEINKLEEAKKKLQMIIDKAIREGKIDPREAL